MLPTLHLELAHWHVAVSLYAVALAIAVLAGIAVAVRRGARPDAIAIAAPLVVVAGMTSAEAWHLRVHASPGLSSMGGIAGGLVAAAVVSRTIGIANRDLLDALLPGVLVGFAIGRVGCFLAGCCYGRPTTVAWGIVFPALGPPPRCPVQLIEAALDLGLAWCCRRPQTRGVTAGLGMIGYALIRVVLEPWRDPVAADVIGRAGPSAVYWCACLLALMGFWLSLRPARDVPRVAV